MIQQRCKVLLPHCENLQGFDSAIEDAQHVAEYLATLTVMPQLVKGWELHSIRADQGSVLVRVFCCNVSALALLGENSKNSLFLQTLAKRGALCRRAVGS